MYNGEERRKVQRRADDRFLLFLCFMLPAVFLLGAAFGYYLAASKCDGMFKEFNKQERKYDRYSN